MSNHEDETIKAKANVILLNILNTKNEKEITECFKSFYASVSRISEGKVDKISIYLHNNIFAKLNDRILEAEFPGLTTRSIQSIENTVGKEFIRLHISKCFV